MMLCCLCAIYSWGYRFSGWKVDTGDGLLGEGSRGEESSWYPFLIQGVFLVAWDGMGWDGMK